MSYHADRLPQAGPEGPVDVLSIINATASWVDYRANRFGGLLRRHGISHSCLTSRDVLVVDTVLARNPAKIVLNEVFQLEPEAIARLAGRFPNTQFVNLNHGSPVSLGIPRWMATHPQFMQLAVDRPNCHYGHVMEPGRFVGPPGAKIISLPNVATLPPRYTEPTERLLNTERPHVLISGRNVEGKNLITQVMAAVLLHGWLEKGIVVHFMSTCAEDEHRPLMNLLRSHGIEAHYHTWAPWSAYMDWMAMTIDLSFCCSLTESFGLIACESMLMGIPVIGSHAIEFLPEAWKANPQNPVEIASMAMHHLNNYSTSSWQSARVARAVCKQNEIALKDNLKSLLNTPGQAAAKPLPALDGSEIRISD
jgi:glycosyltransferase involved in cell wall biosynthesis